MPIVSGVDGCRGGWICASKDLTSGKISISLHVNAKDLLTETQKSSIIGIDIPIGLPKNNIRKCDIAAKKILGKRHMCIFPAPFRTVMEQSGSREEASILSQAINGTKVSCQTWNIIPKIREIDLAIDELENKHRVIEVHPEISFQQMNNQNVLLENKKKEEGLKLRRQLIENNFYRGFFEDCGSNFKKSLVADDDILDAMAALWTSERKFNGVALKTSHEAEIDSKGIPMEIWY